MRPEDEFTPEELIFVCLLMRVLHEDLEKNVISSSSELDRFLRHTEIGKAIEVKFKNSSPAFKQYLSTIKESVLGKQK